MKENGLLSEEVMKRLDNIKTNLEGEHPQARLMVSMSSHGGNCKGCSGTCRGSCRGNCDGTCVIQ